MRAVAAAVLTVVLAGCSSQRAWVYRPNSHAGGAAAGAERIVVLPFQDGRRNVNSNRIGLYMVPIFPFGWANYEVPEGVMQHVTSAMWTNYKPTEDYAKALAEELRATGLFREAFFDFKEGEADLAVHGEIVSTKYHGKVLSYGLSLYGPMLWFIGLPAGTVSNDLALQLRCVDHRTGATLLARRYDASPYSRVTWLYSAADDFNYPAMVAEVYRQFVADLRVSLNGRQATAPAPD
jgi:hypothetical protein